MMKRQECEVHSFIARRAGTVVLLMLCIVVLALVSPPPPLPASPLQCDFSL